MIVNGLFRTLMRREPRAREAPGRRDEVAVLDMLINAALAQIALQYQSGDSHDAKSIGFLAADAAAFAVIGPARFDRFWWIPLLGFGLSIVCFTLCLRGRKYDRGPDLAAFYSVMGGAGESAGKRQRLAQLLRAVGDNEAILPSKARWYTTGVRLFALSVAGSAALFGVVR